MPYKMHPKQFDNVIVMSSNERYEHFITKVADWEQLWILVSEDECFYTRMVENEFEYLSVWPHPVYAEAVNSEYDLGLTIKEIAVDEFLERWIPLLNEKSLKVGVFPDLKGTVWIIDPDELSGEISGEMSQYE